MKPADFCLRAMFVPENVVLKVRVELTLGHHYRFLSLARVNLINVIKCDLVRPPEDSSRSVRAQISYSVR